MSCIPQEIVEKSNTATASQLAFPNPDLMDKLLRAIGDEGAYESDEPKPSHALVKYVATVLGNLRYRANLEVYPQFGEINISWRNPKNGARVKATFMPNAELKIYLEQMLLGKVSSSELIRNADPLRLEKSLEWLYSA